MIIRGHCQGNPPALARYLQSAIRNERVSILNYHNLIAQSLDDAFKDMDFMASASHTDKPLYHASINPHPSIHLTDEEKFEAVNTLEECLGFIDHPRAIILHERQKREHFHIVWSRMNLDRMELVYPLGGSYPLRKAQFILEELYEHPLSPQRLSESIDRRDSFNENLSDNDGVDLIYDREFPSMVAQLEKLYSRDAGYANQSRTALQQLGYLRNRRDEGIDKTLSDHLNSNINLDQVSVPSCSEAPASTVEAHTYVSDIDEGLFQNTTDRVSCNLDLPHTRDKGRTLIQVETMSSQES